MKKRKKSGYVKDLFSFRNELLSLLEEWEIYNLSKTYFGQYPMKKIADLVLKINKPDELLDSLLQKRKKSQSLRDIYERYILSKYPSFESIPRNLDKVIRDLVQYFYNSAIFKVSTDREEEKKFVESDYNHENYRFVEFGNITIPCEILCHIFDFIEHNYENLVSVGLVNEVFYFSYLSTWKSVKVTPRNLKRISMFVLKNVRYLSLIQEDEDEDKPSLIFHKKNLSYLFSHLNVPKIWCLNLSKLKNTLSYKNFWGTIIEQEIVFEGLTKLKFCDISHRLTVGGIIHRLHSQDGEDVEPGIRKKQMFRTGEIIQSTEMSLFPNVKELHNPVLEEFMLISPKEILREQIRKIDNLFINNMDFQKSKNEEDDTRWYNVYLRSYENDLKNCEIKQCQELSIYPLDHIDDGVFNFFVEGSNPVEKTFNKLKLEPSSLKKLTIYLSSRKDIINLKKYNMKLENFTLSYYSLYNSPYEFGSEVVLEFGKDTEIKNFEVKKYHEFESSHNDIKCENYCLHQRGLDISYNKHASKTNTFFFDDGKLMIKLTKNDWKIEIICSRNTITMKAVVKRMFFGDEQSVSIMRYKHVLISCSSVNSSFKCTDALLKGIFLCERNVDRTSSFVAIENEDPKGLIFRWEVKMK